MGTRRRRWSDRHGPSHPHAGNGQRLHSRTGVFHSFAMFDRRHIIDALLALAEQLGLDVSGIRDVFITHVHGDHVFGFPFLLLEQKVHLGPRRYKTPHRGWNPVRERTPHTRCQLAFPGSLESMLEHVTWVMDDVGRLCPTAGLGNGLGSAMRDAVEPHGYRFEHDDGAILRPQRGVPVHASRSTTPSSARRWPSLRWAFQIGVPSTHHHKPGDVRALAGRCSTPLGITHTYIDDTSPHPTVLESQFPEIPRSRRSPQRRSPLRVARWFVGTGRKIDWISFHKKCSFFRPTADALYPHLLSRPFPKSAGVHLVP